jgi:chromosome segregation ATPase
VADLELANATTAIVSALVGSGSGLVTSAIRVAKRFSKLEAKVEELDNEISKTNGLTSWFRPVTDTLRQRLDEIAPAIETLRMKIEEAERRNRASRQNAQQRINDIQSGLKLELANFRMEINDKIDSEVEKTLRGSLDLSSEEDLKRRISDLEKKYERLLERVAALVEDEGKKWNDLQRTLGRLEGHFKTSLSSPGMPRVSPPKGSGGSR